MKSFLSRSYILLLFITAGAVGAQDGGDITIIEDQGRGVVNLSAKNTGSSHYKVMLDIESTGLEFSKPVPHEAIVPAGTTVHMLTLTPKPGVAWRYRYSTSYAEYSGPLPDPATLLPPPPTETPQTPPAPVKEEPVPPAEIPEQQVESQAVQEETPVTGSESVPRQASESPETGQHVIYDPERPGEVIAVPETVSIENTTEPTLQSANETTETPVPANVDPDPGITLYIQPDCPECSRAQQFLDGLKVKYQLVDLSTDSREAKGMWTQLMEQGVGGVISPPVIAKGSQMYFEVDDVTALLSRLVAR